MKPYNQKIRGHYEIDIHRDGKIIEIRKDNHLTFQGMSYLFQHLFQPYPTTLIVSTPPVNFTIAAFIETSPVSNNDTATSHPTWSLSPIFSDNVQAWVPGYPAEGKIANPIPNTFHPLIEGVINGFAIFGDEVYVDGGSHNPTILLSVLEFTNPVPVLKDDAFSVIYTIGLTHSIPFLNNITAFRPISIEYFEFGN